MPWALMLPMLPVMRPTNTRLIVSLKTAKALGLIASHVIALAPLRMFQKMISTPQSLTIRVLHG